MLSISTNWTRDQPAIVFAQEGQVKSEPNLEVMKRLSLHEGTKVQVLDTVNDWKEIKLKTVKQGGYLQQILKRFNLF